MRVVRLIRRLMIRLDCNPCLPYRWVDVHLVVCGEGEVDKAGFLYPVNVLRNVASQLVLTKWTFVIDADILPHARAQVYDLQIAQAYASYLPSRKVRDSVRRIVFDKRPGNGLKLGKKTAAWLIR